MFNGILLYEIKSKFKNISTYLYFLIFYLLAVLLTLAAGGAFKGVEIGLGVSSKLFVNAPFVVNQYIGIINYLGLFVIAPIMGQSTYKDYGLKFDQLIFSTPISKAKYLVGRFLGNFVVLFFILSSIGLGVFSATLMPLIEQRFLTENSFLVYFAPYLTTVLPNIFILGAIFFSLATLLRKMMPVYVASIVIFIGWTLADILMGTLDNKLLSSLIDPFGMNAISYLTEYWSVAEKNTNLIFFNGVFGLNRIIWISLATLGLIITYKKYSFSYAISNDKKKTKTKEIITTFNFTSLQKSFSLKNSISLFLKQTIIEFKLTLKSTYFFIILLCGIGFILVVSSQLGEMYGTNTYPVTYQMIETIGGSFSIFVLIILTLYSGELIWRERNANFNQIMDSLPVSSWPIFLSKLCTLIAIQFFLMIIIFICCLLIQTFKGYYNYEFNQYFIHLFGINFLHYTLLAILAMSVHAIINNKFISYLVIILYYISSIWLYKFGFEHQLYRYGASISMKYSDMNGHGHFFKPFFWFELYWVIFALILILLTKLFWQRGMDRSLKIRLKIFLRRFNFHLKMIFALLFFLWIIVGSYIYYNTNILNKYSTKIDSEKNSYRYEKIYKINEQLPSLSVVSVNANIDLFPATRNLTTSVHYQLTNKTKNNVDKIILNTPLPLKLVEINFSLPVENILIDKELGVSIYQFKSPIKQNQTIMIDLITKFTSIGFVTKGSFLRVVHNGSFFNNREILPTFGYDRNYELSNDKTRKKYDLSSRKRMPDINNNFAKNRTYLSSDGNWIDFEATISTSKDQIAIAPGYLQKSWVNKGRRFFHYKMDSKILNFFSFVSAKFLVKKDKWKNINIEIYHHPSHKYNIDRMIDSIKKSLDYFTKNFGPYQHKQIRIIEFPRYVSFAQAFPNTILYSESIGFIAKVDQNDKDDLDYPFYVTAHEVAHQWWAHQVIGANVQGATLFSESLAQYSSFMVMENEYGKDKMKKFLKYELDKYLSGRSQETKQELPLILNENQGYIHYNKGGIVMYALRDYIGEDVLNKALKDFIRDYKFQNAPFVTSRDFIKYLKKVTPSKYLYLVEDMFEKIVLYNNRAIKSSAKKSKDGKFIITFNFHTKKNIADGQGKENPVKLHDWIEIGAFDKDKKKLYLKKHLITKEENEIELLLDEIPHTVGIDPFNKLIDRKSDDNITKVLD